MDARGLAVPRQRDVAGLAAANRQPRLLLRELDDPLGAVAVGEEQERPAEALRLDPSLQLDGRGAMQRVGQLNRAAL